MQRGSAPPALRVLGVGIRVRAVGVVVRAVGVVGLRTASRRAQARCEDVVVREGLPLFCHHRAPSPSTVVGANSMPRPSPAKTFPDAAPPCAGSGVGAAAALVTLAAARWTSTSTKARS